VGVIVVAPKKNKTTSAKRAQELRRARNRMDQRNCRSRKRAAYEHRLLTELITEPYLQPGQQNGSNQPSPLEPFPQPYQWWVPPPAA